jgi:DNA-binding CsgD family transcriptional regulator
MGTVLSNQGHLAARQRQWKQAVTLFEAAVAAYQIGGHRHDMLEAMIGLGAACHHVGRDDDALEHLHAAEALADEAGAPQRLAEVRAAIAEITEAPSPSGALTARQAEVLGLLARGLTNKQIAAQLYLSPGTVERHLATVYARLGLSGRVEATRYAMEHGRSAGGTDGNTVSPCDRCDELNVWIAGFGPHPPDRRNDLTMRPPPSI